MVLVVVVRSTWGLLSLGGGYAPQAVYALRQFMPLRQFMSLGLGQFFP